MKSSLIAGCLLLCLSLSAQSPWVRSRAGLYAQAAWHFIPTYSSLFDQNGKDFPLDRKLSEGTLQFYGEYGLTRRTTAVVSVPFRFMKAGAFLNNTATPATTDGYLYNFGNISLAIRQNLLDKRVPLTLTLRVDAPAKAYSDLSGLRAGYNTWTVMPMLSTGYGFGPGYAFVYAGYGYRSNNYSHLIDAGGEAGIQIDKFWLIGFSELVYSLNNGHVQLPEHNLITNLYVNNQGYWSVGIKGIWAVNRFFGIVVSTAGALQAKWVPKSPGLGLGIYFKWD